MTRPEACQDPVLLDQYAALLSDEERTRWQRFVFPRDRHAFLVSRALVRSVLGRVLGAHPAELRFQAGAHGKPNLADVDPGHRHATLSFNLSHTQGMAMLAVGLGKAIGADVESTDRQAALDVAERFFSAGESKALLALAPADQPERFWSLWTLKESYLKATGQGLHAALDEFSFSFDAALDRSVILNGEAAWADRADRWWLAQWCPSPKHMAALCIERTDPRHTPQIQAFELTPLQHERAIPIEFIRTTS